MADRKAPTPPPPDTSTRPDPPPPPPGPRLVEVADRPPAAAPHVPAGTQSLIKRDDTMALAFQGLVPASIGEAMTLSAHLARSSAIPASLRGQPEAVFTVIIAGMEIGLTPIRALQSIINIKGNLAMKADLQLALVRRSGSLDFFDEGFELAGETDGNLKKRLGRVACGLEAELILDLVDNVPDGKPYGWAISQRKGDPQKHVRVFSWNDAERFIYNARDDEDGGGQSGGPRVQKKLSEKSNYVNTPQDMYPKRARVRVLQVTHSDVTAGMPAIEAMEGMVIDGEVVASEPAQAAVPTSSEDAITQAIGAIAAKDSNLALAIQNGFEQLQMGIAKRLQLLRKHEATPDALLSWLKDEYAARATKGKAGRAKPDVLSADQPQPEQPPAENKQPPIENKQPEKPIEQPRGGGMESIKSVADRFKNLRSF